MGNRCEVYFNLEGRKLDPNGKYQVLTRLVLDDGSLDEQQHYKLIAYENNQKLGSYILEGNPSSANAVIEKASKGLNIQDLSLFWQLTLTLLLRLKI